MSAVGRECSCTGIRKCLLCENNVKLQNTLRNTITEEFSKKQRRYKLCIMCGKTLSYDKKCIHVKDLTSSVDAENGTTLHGVDVIRDFVSEFEERSIVREIDETIWKPSQSGRRKQDFGPQVNFKKRKLKLDNFTGLPEFSKTLVERMWTLVPALHDFQPVELCNLEYEPERGSSIDPHFDDFWVWGERLVTLNLLSDSILTFFLSKGDDVEVAVPMPRRSLIIVKGAARYDWKHAIKREHIVSRRIAITLRELAAEFCEGGKRSTVGNELITRAMTFQGKSVHANVKIH
ncbi:alpha-ketoglutarate-dependent dioxygenase alkB homolog 4-like [Montipora foliosa]|uniref:alpha-ketoglutarate-dependent dioxygenase alkB homolog 4-like n=1 Tax=Montipora foliosa TaxID=591990 RepID=UPI0035F15EFC